MTATTEFDESHFEAPWRRPAPRARSVAMKLYAWREPALVLPLALAAAAPFVFAAATAPALLSLSPTADIIGPIAEARAILGGAVSPEASTTPLYSLFLMIGDQLTDTPGRIHLFARAMAALLIALSCAYIAIARFPAIVAVLFTAALAAHAASPFSGAEDLAFSIFLVTATSLISRPADETIARARIEGLIGGLGLACLWLSAPVFPFVGLATLALAPFIGGRHGLIRYLAAALIFCGFVAAVEMASPGFNISRLALAADMLGGPRTFGEGSLALGGVAAGTLVVILAAGVFGGLEHWRGWGVSAFLLFLALIAARLGGANPSPAFLLAAALAVFSVASPFYDGVFRDHDRASVSLALAAAGLALFWTGAEIAHNSRQLFLQAEAAKDAPANIRAELGVVQPGGPTIARWIEEGRFSTPEARELFALAPIDQSAMLLEAAARAKEFAKYGFDVAILTGSDSACVIAERRDCRADGAKAASLANIVFVPRIDLDPGTKAARDRAEALLFTEFKLAEQSALWEIWIRRGAQLPAEITSQFKARI